ncbi:hypothetical protein BpHYR1_004745 [Brachionus plicatilis]|uniref:Uncharacterized protein n=1 Tax=Brachionus plicatilis TaxID=10195 RepID=A0A3M7PN14_BRAPC|nr:hypothetical protein BpHYR1_004745 [Brachionus plicatilis]
MSCDVFRSNYVLVCYKISLYSLNYLKKLKGHIQHIKDKKKLYFILLCFSIELVLRGIILSRIAHFVHRYHIISACKSPIFYLFICIELKK